MKKRISTVILTVLTVAVFVATAIICCSCNPQESQMSQTAESFVNYVARIETPISVDSEASISAAYVLYDHLGETDKNNATVKASKETLDGYKTVYEELKAIKDEQDALAQQQAVQSQFLQAVAKLPAESKLSVDDRTAIENAKSIYEQLNDDSKALAEIVSAYQKLQSADNTVAVLEENARLEQIASAAQEFIDAVNSLEDVTAENYLESLYAVEDLLYEYENLPQEVKDFEGVGSAKEKLDSAYISCNVQKDQVDIASLKSYAEKFTPVATAVTLESKQDIVAAEAVYASMSENAKNATGVAEAYQTIVDAREKYDQLFAVAEQERIDAFISAANAIRTDVENVDITWFDALDKASNAYWALSFESQLLPEVEEAFERWDVAQLAFDKLGFQQIPMTDPNLLFSGDVPPHIVVQMEEYMLAPLREFYGVSTNGALSQYAIAWLNVYVDGVYVGKGEIAFSDLGHIITNSKVVAVLKELAQTNSKVVSGASFSFSMHIEDRAGQFIPSNKTKTSAEKVYTW